MNMRGIFVILMAALLGGCVCSQPLVFNPDPPPLPPINLKKNIRVVLVLGAGGVRAIAHIGVIEELEEAGIPIDAIVCCSGGSIVGAVYADTLDIQYVKSVFKPMRANAIVDINLWRARLGLSEGNRLRHALHHCLRSRTFEELQIPLFIVTTDLYSAELVTFGGGPLIPAIHASCAVPFVFSPVCHWGRVLVDGGVIDPLPTEVAEMLKPELIIAVDIRGIMQREVPTNLFGIAKRCADITHLWQSETCLRYANVVIRPELRPGIGTFDDQFNEHLYEAGKEAAVKSIPEIKRLLTQPHPVNR